MSTNPGDLEEARDDDVGLVGGGSVAETVGGDAAADAELDEHGDNLTRADEDER